MEDLVLLRELVRTPGTNCFPLNINHVFTHIRFEELFERIITRAAHPCNAIAIALCLNLIGVKSINACIRAGKDLETFARWYRKRLNVLLHIDVGPEEFKEFRGAMDRTYVLALQTSKKLTVPDRGFDASQDTRPMSLIQRDLQSRKSNSSAGTTTKPTSSTSHKRKRSPRALRTINVDPGSLSQSSKLTSGIDHSVRNYSREVYRDIIKMLGIFIRLTCGHTRRCPLRITAVGTSTLNLNKLNASWGLYRSPRNRFLPMQNPYFPAMSHQRDLGNRRSSAMI